MYQCRNDTVGRSGPRNLDALFNACFRGSVILRCHIDCRSLHVAVLSDHYISVLITIRFSDSLVFFILRLIIVTSVEYLLTGFFLIIITNSRCNETFHIVDESYSPAGYRIPLRSRIRYRIHLKAAAYKKHKIISGRSLRNILSIGRDLHYCIFQKTSAITINNISVRICLGIRKNLCFIPDYDRTTLIDISVILDFADCFCFRHLETDQ